MKNTHFLNMLFVTNEIKSLKQIIFQKHDSFPSDELNILTGYIGSSVIEDLGSLKIDVKIIYGLAREKKLNEIFYNDLCKLDSGSTQIYCPDILSHAKIYIWKNRGEIVYILNGSANFSNSGLETPHREVLSEVSEESFKEFETYYDRIFNSSVRVNKVDLNKFGCKENKNSCANSNVAGEAGLDPGICVTDSLFEKASKINWGHGTAHTNPRDAYIPIRKEDIVNYPQLFPEKAEKKGWVTMTMHR